MGATNSTRRITVVNDETSGVIKISDSVVHRLRGEWDTQTSSKGSSPSSSKSSGGSGDAPQSTGQQAVNPRKEPSSPAVTATGSTPSPPSSKGSEVLKVSRRERDDEVKRVENYWRDKLRETERRNEELHHQTVNEFSRGLMEVESLFMRPSCDAVCQDHQVKVKRCYEDNLPTSLNCSKEVKAFSDCVDAMRQKTVATKG